MSQLSFVTRVLGLTNRMRNCFISSLQAAWIGFSGIRCRRIMSGPRQCPFGPSTDKSLVATTAIMQLANYIGNAQKIWVRGIQKRVDVTASVLGSMKV